MKYKAFILFFNVFILFSLLSLIIIPISFFGANYIYEFWGKNWFLPAVFFAALVVINVFFVFNWEILRNIQAANWKQTAFVLEKRIYIKKIITFTNVKLLIQCYILTGEVDKIKKLEEYIKSKKRKIYNKTFLYFASAHIMSDSFYTMTIYFGNAVLDKALKGKEWIALYYAFSLLSTSNFDKALVILRGLKPDKNTLLLELLRLYFLFLCEHREFKESVVAEKNIFIKTIMPEKMKAKIEAEKSNVYILFFSKIIEQAENWAFSSDAN